MAGWAGEASQVPRRSCQSKNVGGLGRNPLGGRTALGAGRGNPCSALGVGRQVLSEVPPPYSSTYEKNQSDSTRHHPCLRSHNAVFLSSTHYF